MVFEYGVVISTSIAILITAKYINLYIAGFFSVLVAVYLFSKKVAYLENS